MTSNGLFWMSDIDVMQQSDCFQKLIASAGSDRNQIKRVNNKRACKQNSRQHELKTLIIVKYTPKKDKQNTYDE